MSAGTHVKAGLVAYSQGAPEVIVRMDKASARSLLGVLRAADIAGHLLTDSGQRLMEQLRVLDLAERPRGG